jgi:hypothetical protein
MFDSVAMRALLIFMTDDANLPYIYTLLTKDNHITVGAKSIFSHRQKVSDFN